MKKIWKIVDVVPAGVASAVVTIAVLYFSLSPRPVGAEMVGLFIGFDKVVHFLMYAIVTTVYLLDRVKYCNPRSVGISAVTLLTLAAIVLGGVMEISQGLTGRRTSDIYDFIANTAGALVAAAVAYVWLMSAFRRFLGKSQ